MRCVAAIDGGGTKTRAGLYGPDGALLSEAEAGASNPIDIGHRGSVAVLANLVRNLLGERKATLDLLVAGIAGAGSRSVAQRLADALMRRLSLRRLIVSNDLVPLLQANRPKGPALLVVAGTGSALLGRDSRGRIRQFGGWGPLLGDEGSAYRLAVAGLRAAVAASGLARAGTILTERLPEAAGLENLKAFKSWTGTASRQEVAALAPAVSRAADEGDPVALGCLETEARGLAKVAGRACAEIQLDPSVPVITHGGLFRNSPLFARCFSETLAEGFPGAAIEAPAVMGHRAVAALASASPLPEGAREYAVDKADALPPTEARIGADRPLDRMTPEEIVEAMCEQDGEAVEAVAAEAPAIAAAIEAVARAFTAGGRLVYVGAGTSGRLGVLDASECPPTFGVPAEQVQALIAGGEEALRGSIEGAEDNTEQAAGDLRSLDPALGPEDVVIGIAASGRTPYVLAALEEAGRAGAETVLVSCNPASRGSASIVIALDTGAEVLAGSTRLKAGTATKMVLNQITTGAMALSGNVYEGLMVQVRPVNEKLRHRANRIVAQLADMPVAEAGELLVRASGSIAVAVTMARLGIGLDEARKRLESAGGSLRAVLESD